MESYADNPAQPSGARLVLALAFSVVLHAAVMFGIRARPPEPLAAGAAGPVITARIAPEPDGERLPEPPTDQIPQPAIAPAELSAESRASESGSLASEAASRTQAAQPAVPQDKPAASRGGLEVPVIQDPTYYPARLLDEYPRPVVPVEPQYPSRAALNDVPGKVLLLLLIDETGRVNEVSVIEATPPGYFEEAALAVFRNVQFVPARKDGRAVRSRVVITVNYESVKQEGTQR